MTRIAVVLGTVRPNRAGAAVAEWVVAKANTVEGAQAELVDIADFNLPVFAEPLPPSMAAPQDPNGARFNETIQSFDAVIFVTPEYNHSIPGALKNAIDFLEPVALANKAVGGVSYSFSNGIRPIEHLRQIVASPGAYMVSEQVALSLVTDFENMSVFKPADFHDGEVPAMVQSIVAKDKVLAALR